MEGCAPPDIHALMVHEMADPTRRISGDSYDLADHQEILRLRPLPGQVGISRVVSGVRQRFLAVGSTCYESWQNYMENALINDELDFAAISGWESTAIENHSGIVDNLRNLKSDPHLIGDTLQSIRPCAKQRSLSAQAPAKVWSSISYLFNDTSTVSNWRDSCSPLIQILKTDETELQPDSHSRPQTARSV